MKMIQTFAVAASVAALASTLALASTHASQPVERIDAAATRAQNAVGGAFIPGAVRDGALVAMLKVDGVTGEMKHVRNLLYVVVEGEGVLTAAGADTPFRVGDVLLVSARTPHTITSESDEAIVWIVMHGEPVPESEDTGG